VNSPRVRTWQVESEPWLPDGDGERFSGYGVMGLPFASGHVLALRRFPASSIGPAYTAVWHRDPTGRWTVYTDVDPRLACRRYLGNTLTASRRTEIGLRWTGAWSFVVEVPATGLIWQVRLAETGTTRLLNAISGAVPAWVMKRPSLVGAFGAIAGALLGTDSLALTGRMPHRQRFRFVPRRFVAAAPLLMVLTLAFPVHSSLRLASATSRCRSAVSL
jgi:hypothetical protein